MRNLVRYFIPPLRRREVGADESKIAMKSLLVLSLSAVFWGPFFIAMLFALDAPLSGTLGLIGFVSALSSCFLVRFSVPVNVAGQVFVLGQFLLVAFVAFVNGGVQFSGLPWLVLLPALAVTIIGRWAGVFWSLVAAMFVFLLWWLDRQNIKFSHELAEADRQIFSIVVIVGVMVMMFLLADLHAQLSARSLRIRRQLDERQRDFVTNVSHELLTPLNGIVGMSELLSRPTNKQRNTAQLKIIAQSGRGLLTLVEHILSYSEASNGQVTKTIERFELDTLMQEVIATCSHGVDSDCLVIDYGLPAPNLSTPFVLGERHHLYQILFQLLSNAIKFSESGRIEIKAVVHDVQIMEFSVVDNGSGFDESKRSEMFASFRQADNSLSRRYGGVGLGLNICQNLVKANRGEISIMNREPNGCEVKFTFALRQTD